MIKLIILLFFSTSIVLSTKAQSIKKSDLHGTWSAESGLPGRSIKQSDSTTIHLMPVTYTITIIKLKRFGRAIKETKSYHGVDFDSKYRAKWKLDGDTLKLQFKRAEEKYFIDQSIEYRLFLNSTVGNTIYSRMELY